MSKKIYEIRNGSVHGPVRGYVSASNISTLNPFVLWDHFYIPEADGLAGFDFHGHSGVATITYPQVGDIKHEDTGGHTGILRSGGVQIMAAGSGVLHKETVHPADKVADAFQLWVALPSESKEMGSVEYSTAQKHELPIVENEGSRTKVVIGRYNEEESPIQPPVEMTYLHVGLNNGQSWEHAIPENQTTAFIYVRAGKVLTGDLEISKGGLGVYESEGKDIDIQSFDQNSEFVIVTGKPIQQDIISNGSSVHSTAENLIFGVQKIKELQDKSRAN